jgi:hypothetical protein
VDEKGEVVSALNYYAFDSFSESVDNSDTFGKYKPVSLRLIHRKRM